MPNTVSYVLPRADPGYVQWLERQSMLGSARELTGKVSGTDIIWRHSTSLGREPLLQSVSPHWLDVNPYSVTCSEPLLRALVSPAFLSFLKEAGFQGLFLSPTGETGSVWSSVGGAHGTNEDGEDVVSLRLSPSLGKDRDLTLLINALEKMDVQFGGDLPPAATGLGPDFMLQARNASRFEGLYAMLPIPSEDWGILPAASDEWDCRPLEAATVRALSLRGDLPGSLWRDSQSWNISGGWAVTGEVRGVDGQMRRWAYRYAGHNLKPVLLWQDPSAQARRVWSAAIIRHTGLQRQTLAGLRLEALMGLDAMPADAVVGDPSPLAVAPGPEALRALSGEVHRYGGWTVQDDVLPPLLSQIVLESGVDFAR
ncbi:MAG: hypothetical protein J5861_01365, partial [Desulfovibrio sp.]|nr:hypothetical protein [Desulfovibrio sp.]